jgi:hypothetical protein
MTDEDPAKHDLFHDDHSGMTHESRHAVRSEGDEYERSSNRTPRGGSTITLRIKPDRRCLVTQVDPASERRQRRS